MPKPTNVRDYLASLPPERRRDVERVREVILRNLDKGYVENFAYGMIGYAVKPELFPQGYHCAPGQPLPFAALGAGKAGVSLHLMALAFGEDCEKPGALATWFREEWERTGRKLDMGRACVRFRTADDAALDVVAELLRRTPARVYAETYAAALASRQGGSSRARTSGGTGKKTKGSDAPTPAKANKKSKAGKPGKAAKKKPARATAARARGARNAAAR